jgi:hypothetical protein
VVFVRGDAEVACCPLPAGQNNDLRVVEKLARLQLAARRLGCSLRLRGAPSQLRELIDLAGLSDILTAEPVSSDPGGPAGGPDDDGRPPEGPADGAASLRI